jgi:hypothetical protein
MSRISVQRTLVDQLLKYGSLEFRLPDGLTLELGVRQEGGSQEEEPYCYAKVTRGQSHVFLDRNSLELAYPGDVGRLVLDSDEFTADGVAVKVIEVV